MDLAGGYPRASRQPSLNLEPIDARPSFTGRLLSSVRRSTPRRDRFSEAEHLVLVSTTLSLSLFLSPSSLSLSLPPERVLFLVKIDGEARKAREMYAFVHRAVIGHSVARRGQTPKRQYFFGPSDVLSVVLSCQRCHPLCRRRGDPNGFV